MLIRQFSISAADFPSEIRFQTGSQLFRYGLTSCGSSHYHFYFVRDEPFVHFGNPSLVPLLGLLYDIIKRLPSQTCPNYMFLLSLDKDERESIDPHIVIRASMV